ncbi:unnamed protein product [Allacma fusca]|uniref:Uncharacterized protein n=1 Tax=Allacma fusca TaxID=39272 RepID=A0A8J2PKI4_9HEXA|nr:unnamed protein product [Allacma fusca]
MSELKKRATLKAALTRLKNTLDGYTDATITLVKKAAGTNEEAAHETDYQGTEQRIYGISNQLHEFDEKNAEAKRAANPHPTPPPPPPHTPKPEFHLPKM